MELRRRPVRLKKYKNLLSSNGDCGRRFLFGQAIKSSDGVFSGDQPRAHGVLARVLRVFDRWPR